MQLRVLFVCAQNRWRSPTAERIFSHHPFLVTKSAGTKASAAHQISVKDIEWADVIMCMEQEHRDRIRELFPHQQLPPIEVLDIPDLYHYMDPELVEILTHKVTTLFTS